MSSDWKRQETMREVQDVGQYKPSAYNLGTQVASQTFRIGLCAGERPTSTRSSALAIVAAIVTIDSRLLFHAALPDSSRWKYIYRIYYYL